ncbi:MAG: hypothetical protein FD149_2302, partial [Rhodospirillaceae bacterium]
MFEGKNKQGHTRLPWALRRVRFNIMWAMVWDSVKEENPAMVTPKLSDEAL